MARKDNLKTNILENEALYLEGFKNDETPLDEYNLNLLVDGILLNSVLVENMGKSSTLELHKESEDRKNKYKEICMAAFGTDTAPTDIEDDNIGGVHSLTKIISDLQERVRREALKTSILIGSEEDSNAIDTAIANEEGSVYEYKNSTTKLRDLIDSLETAASAGIGETTDPALLDYIITDKGCIINGFKEDVNSQISKLILPATIEGSLVIGLGEAAFMNCSHLTYVELPDTIDTISDSYSIFKGCTSLEYIRLSENLSSISSQMFAGCSKLKSVVIKGNVSYIADEAFYDCTSLESITLPSSLNSVARYAFYNCTALKNVYFEGSTYQWNKIQIENDNIPLNNAKWHFKQTGIDTGEAAAIVYLNTKELVGDRIELDDVYPIQDSSTSIKVMSKNITKYNTAYSSHSNSGLSTSISNSKGVVVTGKLTKSLTEDYQVAEAALDVVGKYVISCSNEGVNTTNKKCYITYSILDGSDNIVQEAQQLSTEPVRIHTEELNAHKIIFYLHSELSSGVTFEGSNSQTFLLQVEHGDAVTSYTQPREQYEAYGKVVTIYGRNLFAPQNLTKDSKEAPFNSMVNNCVLVINGTQHPSVNTVGVHYLKGVMTEDYFITLTSTNDSSVNFKLKTPLLKDDKFTFAFNVVNIGATTTIRDIQVLSGHTDYSRYESPELSTTTANDYGICDISKLRYPYSFISFDHSNAANSGFIVHIKFDPALSRNWTEKQLEKVDNRLDYLEEHIADDTTDLSNYYTKDEIDVALSEVAEDIVVSETEPTVTGETIWLQPISTDTGAVDYIVEQNIGSNFYYEKWNSGIIKYYANSTVASTNADRTNVTFSVDVLKSICKNIISCNVDGYGEIGAGSTKCELKQVSETTDKFSINGLFNSLSANEKGKVYVSIVGLWK